MASPKSTVMEARFFDLNDHPPLDGPSTKEVLFGGDGYHMWVHVDEPGKKGPMHKHTADELFYCVQGQCTFHFPNGASGVLDPGMVVIIPAGQPYQLDNTGTRRMVLLGSRAESDGKARHTEDNSVIETVDGRYMVDGRIMPL